MNKSIAYTILLYVGLFLGGIPVAAQSRHYIDVWAGGGYDALLHDLIQPEERLLTVSELKQDFPCYYKSCQVTDFYPNGKIWLAFTLTLTFTRDFRINV